MFAFYLDTYHQITCKRVELNQTFMLFYLLMFQQFYLNLSGTLLVILTFSGVCVVRVILTFSGACVVRVILTFSGVCVVRVILTFSEVCVVRVILTFSGVCVVRVTILVFSVAFASTLLIAIQCTRYT
jgi:hypothetical protein